MKSNWFLYGPFPFEASAVAGSTRAAIGHLVEQLQVSDRWARLHLPSRQAGVPGRSDGRSPGLYLILRAEEGVEPLQIGRTHDPELLQSTPTLAGFWVIFGPTYLGEGVVGPPDKEPPYVRGVLDACTEEVWWKNLSVYPRTDGTWKPCIFFEWTSELAFRSTLAPPGIPLSPDEIADPDAEDKFSGDWLEQLDEEVVREERRRAEMLRQDNPWLDLPPHRSVMMLTQGFLQKKRVSHEGSFRMIHPEWLGTGTRGEVLDFDVWMDRTFSELAPERTEQERHYLGQPLDLPGHRVGFPISGWLTRGLTVWPASPIDIRKGKLSPRDIGSKLVAQLKQASVITAMVLVLLVGLSWIIFLLTKPRLVAVQEPPPIIPEPAMSVCSADHAKFMDEFRCQIESFAYGADTDQPVCGDKGSKELVKPTPFDLQAEYCGLRDRSKDGWIWPRDAKDEGDAFNYGYVAASKACFNVLGHPYKYKLPTDFSKTIQPELPNPNLFLEHPDLSIEGLSVLIRHLDSACDAYEERMAYQVEGAVFATHVGTRPRDPDRTPFDEQQEGARLRLRLSDRAMAGVKSDLRQCFSAGMADGESSPRRLAELCDFLPGETDASAGALASLGGVPGGSGDEARRSRNTIFDVRKIWQELYGDGGAHSVQTATGDIRQLAAVVDRYNHARFGNPLIPTRGKRSEALWQCHGALTASAGVLDTRFVSTMWDLKVPVPNAYRIEGAGVKTQLSLDAALRSFGSEGSRSAQESGACWQVIARRLAKYTPVHPLLAELDPGGWPSMEQQLCGQICATHYRVASSAAAADWVTPERDLQMCITPDGPGQDALRRHAQRISAIRATDSDAATRFAAAREDLIKAADPAASGSTFRPFTGAGFDQLRMPWNQRSERTLERLSRDYSGAVLQRNASACEQIRIDDAVYYPVEVEGSDRGTTDEVCRASYSRLNSNGRALCDRYWELVPRYAQLRAECQLAVEVGWGESTNRNELERYLFARVTLAEGWVEPDADQICAFNLIAQDVLHDEDGAFLLGSLAPPAWAGQTALGSRIAGGGLGAKEAAGAAYQSATSLSRFGRTRSRNTCSYAASQCFAEKFMEVTGRPGTKPFDWKDEWSRLLLEDIYQTDQRGANRLKERSPWCSLIQPYVNLESGDIDYPCAMGVDEARKSVSRTIDYLAAEIGTEG